jgi:hypothetical protein
MLNPTKVFELIMTTSESGRIIYFDMNGWIDLAKIYYGQPSNREKELLDKILQSSDDGTAIFPISIIHLFETHNIANPRRREDLVALMVKISKYYTITPYWNRLLELEIKNLILEKKGLRPINIRDHFVGKGFSRLMGITPTIASKDISPKLLDELNEDLLKLLNNPEIFAELTTRIYNNRKQEQTTTVKEFERIREKLKQYKDNEYRRKVFLTQNIVTTILPKLVQFLTEMNLPATFAEELFTSFDLDTFLGKLPTALCEFALLFQRDQQLSRPIQVNDIADIWHLTLAIPYSDIVITEKMWVSIAKRARLDEKCDTLILSSIEELNECL